MRDNQAVSRGPLKTSRAARISHTAHDFVGSSRPLRINFQHVPACRANWQILLVVNACRSVCKLHGHNALRHFRRSRIPLNIRHIGEEDQARPGVVTAGMRIQAVEVRVTTDVDPASAEGKGFMLGSFTVQRIGNFRGGNC